MTYEEGREVVVAAYRRLLKAAEEGRGVRFTAEEVEAIAIFDDFISQAVRQYDWVKQDKETADNTESIQAVKPED